MITRLARLGLPGLEHGSLERCPGPPPSSTPVQARAREHRPRGAGPAGAAANERRRAADGEGRQEGGLRARAQEGRLRGARGRRARFSERKSRSRWGARSRSARPRASPPSAPLPPPGPPASRVPHLHVAWTRECARAGARGRRVGKGGGEGALPLGGARARDCPAPRSGCRSAPPSPPPPRRARARGEQRGPAGS